MSSQSLLIDKRIVQRNIEQGKLEVAEYQRILDALPDLSDKVWRRPAATEHAPVVEAAVSTANMDAPAPARAAEVVSDAGNAPRQDATPAFDASF